MSNLITTLPLSFGVDKSCAKAAMTTAGGNHNRQLYITTAITIIVVSIIIIISTTIIITTTITFKVEKTLTMNSFACVRVIVSVRRGVSCSVVFFVLVGVC